MSAVVICLTPFEGGYEVTVVHEERNDYSDIASEWFPTWKAARAAAESLEERLIDAGVQAEISEGAAA